MTSEQIRLLKDWEQGLRDLDKKAWKEKGFNMEHWAKGEHPPSTPELDCGTTCCAYGYGTTLPSWHSAGLGLTKISGEHRLWRPTLNALEILGLSYEDWEWITASESYDCALNHISPSIVADRIHRVIQRREGM
jgi:hypothetical protein